VEALAGIGAGILALIGYPSYLRGVRAGTTRPAIASWWAWLLSAVVVTAGQLSARSGWALLLAVAQTTGLGAIAVVAQRRATWRPRPTDMSCIAVAVLPRAAPRPRPAAILLPSHHRQVTGVARRDGSPRASTTSWPSLIRGRLPNGARRTHRLALVRSLWVCAAARRAVLQSQPLGPRGFP
jgi:hypothetical protein